MRQSCIWSCALCFLAVLGRVAGGCMFVSHHGRKYDNATKFVGSEVVSGMAQCKLSCLHHRGGCTAVNLVYSAPHAPFRCEFLHRVERHLSGEKLLPNPSGSFAVLDYTAAVSDNCTWVGATSGVGVSCGAGEVAAGGCGSDFANGCGNHIWHQLKCCKSDILADFNCTVMTGDNGESVECPDNKLLTSACGSGMSKDCRHGDDNYYFHFKCCDSHFAYDLDDCAWHYDANARSCRDGYVMTGKCGSGLFPKCSGFTVHGIRCCRLF